MKISALRLFNVKRFAGRGVAIEGIGNGVNVLCAANEFGKSTSFEALQALFFQPHSSQANDVRNLRPYSGGNPMVEADIATADGNYRIAKQYFGGRNARVCDLSTGRLVAQADEAENFIARLVHGGSGGPAGLLWVRQGITGIERRTPSEEKDEQEARQSLLQSVQGEVEAVTGGRRMAGIMARTEAQLSELVTASGRVKSGSRYAAAIEERDRLDIEEKRLSGEVATLRGALEERASAMKRLAEISRAEDVEERRKDVEQAQMAFDAAKAQSEKLKAVEAQMGLATELRDAAARDLTAFRQAREKAGQIGEKRREAERRRSEALTRRREADETREKARADAEAAEIRARDERDLLDRLNAALKAKETSERLAGLKERLERAETARRELEGDQAKLTLLEISADAVEQLQALEIEIANLHAVEDASRCSVAIEYAANATATVTMDGDPLPDGETRTYDRQARLSVPGTGTITLRSNHAAPGDDRLKRARAKRQSLLASMGVDDLPAARARQVQAQRLQARLGELKGRLSQLAPEGLPQLRQEVEAHGAVDAGSLELKADPDQVRAALATAEQAMVSARQAQREAEPLHRKAYDDLVLAETELASLQTQMAHVDALLGPEAERENRELALVKLLADRNHSLAEAEADVKRLRAENTDLQSFEARLKRARSAEQAAGQEISVLNEKLAGLNAEIRTRSDEAVEEKWRETAEALAAESARVAAFEKEVAILKRLASALEAARSEARELYLRPVMTELEPLLSLLFDDVSIAFDEQTLLPHAIRRNGQEEKVDRLSGGMREQLSVLTRLAFARLLAKNGRPAPVILDDALVYSDDDRIEKMFDALHRQSMDQQIIVFSCRQRAFQKLGGNILQMTDWNP